MKMTFKLQIIISVVCLMIGLGLSLYLGKDRIYYNLAWALVGLGLLLHPVYPSSIVFQKPEDAPKAMRIAGAVLVYIGLTNGFAV